MKRRKICRYTKSTPPLVNTEFSAEIGGAKGIPPEEVADELLVALEKDQFDVPVGNAKQFFEKAQA